MKKITVLSLIVAIAMVFSSCGTLQKNGKSKEKPVKEQSQDIEDSNEDVDNDW